MVLRILLLLCALGPLSIPVQAGLWDSITSYFRKPAPAEPPAIKVLVVHDQPGVVLEVKGKYKIFDPHTNEYISTRFAGKRKFIQAVRDGIKWGEEFPGVYQLMIVPDEKGTTTIVDGIEYPGPIYVYDIGGTISVVNQVKIENYLSSILAQRYRNQQFHDETLAAIAIAARTAAYFRAENPKSQYWSVDSSQVGYQGYAAVEESSPIEKAIRATRYMVMSRSAPSEEQIVPLLAEWSQGEKTNGLNQAVYSQMTLAEANEMAKKGLNAAQILEKAFPGVHIELIHYPSEAKKAN